VAGMLFADPIYFFIFALLILKTYMLIIDTRDSESLDKALKKYKKKFEKAGILKQLKSRQSFTKPSIRRRGEVLKAVYRDVVTREMEAQ
jgi:small subunit ribosomal protein S21